MSDKDEFLQSPFNALPGAVVALALAIVGFELVFWVGNRGLFGGPEAVGWRVAMIENYALWPAVLPWVIERGEWTSPELLRFLTYPFIHYGFVGAIFAVAMLLALGKLVGEVFGNIAVLIVFFASALIGGVVYCGIFPDQGPLFGAFPGVYGLIGSYSFLLWVGYGQMGENQYRAFSLIGFLMGIQLFFSFAFGSQPNWIADLAGFLVGFVITPSLAPGSFRRFLDRMRQR